MTNEELEEELFIEAMERGFMFGSRDMECWIEAEMNRRSYE